MSKDLVSLIRSVEAEREERFKKILKEVCGKALAVALFGSRARGDNTPLSDWDILAIIETGEYRIESSGIGQIIWLPLDKIRNVIEWSMIILDALVDAKLLCGDGKVLDKARRQALKYIEEKHLTRTRIGWIPLHIPS